MSSSPTAASASAANATTATTSEPNGGVTAPPPSTSSVSARVRAFTGQNGGGSVGGPTPAFPLPHAAPVPVTAGSRTRVGSNLPPPIPPHGNEHSHTDDKPAT